MSALATKNTTLFGANGVTDPVVFKTGVGVSRTIDFAKSNMAAAAGESENFEFIALPESFIIKGLYIEELEKADTELSVTVKAYSDGATIGSAVTIGDTAPLKSVQTVTHKVLDKGDVLCLCIAGGASGVNVKSGVLKVNVIGDLPDGDSMANFAVSVPYRDSGQTDGANASKGDLLTRR